jgi:hypothetical protein
VRAIARRRRRRPVNPSLSRTATINFVLAALGLKMRPASSSKPSPSQALWLLPWPSLAHALALSGSCLSGLPYSSPFPFDLNLFHLDLGKKDQG